MTTPVIEDIEGIVAEEMQCECIMFQDYPCENEFSGPDFLCDECRPRCQAEMVGLYVERCCGAALTCMLVPLLGTDRYVHIRRLFPVTYRI